MTPLQACTQLLLHFDESDGNFTDTSVARRTVFRNSNTESAYSASGVFGGCLEQTHASARFATYTCVLPFGATSGFIDLRLLIDAYPSGAFARRVFSLSSGSNSSSGPEILVERGGFVTGRLYNTSGATNALSSPANAIAAGSWAHLRFAWSGAQSKLFVNGTVVSTGTVSGTINAGQLLAGIAGNPYSNGSGDLFAGRADELIYVQGLVFDMEDFTPPATPYDDIPRSLLNPKTADSPQRLLGTAPPAANWKVGSNPPILLRDRIDGGFGQIVGTVKEKSTPTNVPLRRKVRLFHELSGRFLRETWSDGAGNYAFTDIDPTQRYTVVSYDYLQNYRAVIADNILPEVMA